MISLDKYIPKYFIFSVKLKLLYPDNTYTFGIYSAVTVSIAAVKVSSALSEYPPVELSYADNSLEDNILLLSPDSTIIPLSSLVTLYFCAISILCVASIFSTIMLAFDLPYCFAKSKYESSSEYPTKYI
ncbi:hypothetical protein D3C72_1393940 [compost metagenome]